MIAERIEGQERSLGDGVSVLRVLPRVTRRHIGPFVFADLFGPRPMDPYAMAVRPHPHIGLATVTWLFAGRVVHRDSLGTHAVIEPGAVNWMSAGRGIVHSERNEGWSGTMHGLQLWAALPEDAQDGAPSFQQVPADALPTHAHAGLTVRLVAGDWLGVRSPVVAASPVVLAEVGLAARSNAELPRAHDEIGVLAVSGDVRVAGEPVPVGTLAVLAPGSPVELGSDAGGTCMVLGGTPLGPRHMWWNLVHTDPARIEQAKDDWRAGRFPLVPGETERIELP